MTDNTTCSGFKNAFRVVIPGEAVATTPFPDNTQKQ
jgi:hypothetical protein